MFGGLNSELEIVSRIGKIKSNNEKLYQLLSDFTNLGNYIPKDKVADFKSDKDSCSFTLDKMGNFAMRIIEREPHKLIKICNGENISFEFNMWIQLKQVKENDIRVKVTLKAKLNPMIKSVAKKPLTTFINTLVDKLETIHV